MDQKVIDTLIAWAKKEEPIRALLLTGSRAEKSSFAKASEDRGYFEQARRAIRFTNPRNKFQLFVGVEKFLCSCVPFRGVFLMANNFNIALLQLVPTNSVEQNLVKGLDACKKAQSLGADIALFPEMWQLNYNSDLMTLDNAIYHSDNFIQAFCKQAKKLNMAIAITYLGRGKNKPTNNIAVIDRSGTVVLDYAKVHVCNFEGGTEVTLESGSEFKVAALSCAGGSVKLGAMICFDREFPESARTLMLKGAEIILVPNACPLYNDPVIGNVRLAVVRSRAFENMVGIAMTNYAQPKTDGHSCAFNVDGKKLVMVGEREEIALASFDLDKAREWRKKEVWGNKFRRPHTYEC